MEDLTNREFQNSLDITNDELEKYIPQLLEGLWELGSVPEYILELVDRNIAAKFTTVTDLGCGKGSILIQLARQFDIKGLGVDMVPDFIEEATLYAKKYAVTEKVEFRTENLVETIKATSNQDIVIYGYDSEILGDLSKTLAIISKCIKEDGYVLLEFMYAHTPTENFKTEREMIKDIEESGCTILDRIDWNREALRITNKQNTEIIKGNVERLGNLFPDKKEIFQEYLRNQIIECEELQNNYGCTTLLLGKGR